MTTTTMEIIGGGTEWGSIDFKGRWCTLSVQSRDKDGDLSIEVDNHWGGGIEGVTINQEQLKQLIEHLNKQII